MATYAFAGGVTGSPGWGDRWIFSFNGTFAFNDTWTLDSAFQASNLTIGGGRVTVQGQPTTCATYKNRVYLGIGSEFNFSDNSDPTEWEAQGPGSGFIPYLSQLGGQDGVTAFSQLQGRLIVFARRSVQIWTTDGDPSLFSLAQQLANIGTVAPLSAQNLGDYDVLFLDDTGIRSLRSREVTLNAFVDDLGTPIDARVRAAKVGYTVANAAAVTDPVTGNYWLHVGGTIFVFSRHESAQVQAWSTYLPLGNDNVLFTPQKFVTYNGQVYCRSAEGKLYQYGDANNATYDVNSQVTMQLPWLCDERPATFKQATGVDYVIAGKWTIKCSMNPKVAFTDVVSTSGSATVPDDLLDSSYDEGYVEYSETGTHFSMQAVSANLSTTTPAVFSAFTLHYNTANVS